MNNGVENNQVAEPVIVPADLNAVPVTPATAPAVQQNIVPNAVPGAVDPNQTAVYSVPQMVQQPAILQPTPQPETTPETTPPEEEKVEEAPKKKRKSSFPSLLFILLVAVGAYAYYLHSTMDQKIKDQQYRCSPASESKEEVALDLNSTIVQELYQKVATNILEDYFQPEWNDTMRVYLAYRQIPTYKFYESNCNLFSNGKMEPYICEVTSTYKPKAFKAESLELEWKKLFGETTKMPRINANLQNGCIGGYEYIPDRDEYVQGYCKNAPTTTLKVKKELKEAVTSNHTIILKEDVKYIGTDTTHVPEYLVSGTYFYTFRLDMNYNYVLISKQYDQKYE